MLTEDNLASLVEMVNGEVEAAVSESRARLETIEAEIAEVRARVSRLCEVLETRKLDLDDLAPRIKELRQQLEQLCENRIHVEVNAAVRAVPTIDIAGVKAHPGDLGRLLEEADLVERKVFLRSFVQRIEVSAQEVKVANVLPIPNGVGKGERSQVLSTGRLVDLRGFEPLTSSMPLKRATNCATGPSSDYSTRLTSPIPSGRATPDASGLHRPRQQVPLYQTPLFSRNRSDAPIASEIMDARY